MAGSRAEAFEEVRGDLRIERDEDDLFRGSGGRIDGGSRERNRGADREVRSRACRLGGGRGRRSWEETFFPYLQQYRLVHVLLLLFLSLVSNKLATFGSTLDFSLAIICWIFTPLSVSLSLSLSAHLEF